MGSNDHMDLPGQDLDEPPERTTVIDVDALVERLKVIRLQPGDDLVLSYPGKLKNQARDYIKQTMERVFPGHRIVILTEGMTLEAVRAAKAEAIGRLVIDDVEDGHTYNMPILDIVLRRDSIETMPQGRWKTFEPGQPWADVQVNGDTSHLSLDSDGTIFMDNPKAFPCNHNSGIIVGVTSDRIRIHLTCEVAHCQQAKD